MARSGSREQLAYETCLCVNSATATGPARAMAVPPPRRSAWRVPGEERHQSGGEEVFGFEVWQMAGALDDEKLGVVTGPRSSVHLL
jgi:hypothetical protein